MKVLEMEIEPGQGDYELGGLSSWTLSCALQTRSRKPGCSEDETKNPTVGDDDARLRHNLLKISPPPDNATRMSIYPCR